MYTDIDPKEIFTLREKILVDVRSPEEFEEFHIPGAINVPLFGNEEKKLIGYVYRREGVERAKEVGEEIAKRKLEDLYRTFRGLKERYGNVIVYCWRGGMRSRGICEAMSQRGIHLYRLRGGYRAYRRFMLKDMERLCGRIHFIVLTGKTGVGKTKVLRMLKEEGLPVIDLEGLAKDRGSVFGSVGIGERVSQKMFESLLYEDLRRVGSGFAFIEDESRWIGNVHIPEAVWRKKVEGVFVELTASLETRIENIFEDYTKREGWEKEAAEAVKKIRKYLGPQKFRYVMDLFERGDYREAVRFLIEEYYDRRYRRFGDPVLEISSDDPEECVSRLKELYLRYEGKVQDSVLQGK